MEADEAKEYSKENGIIYMDTSAKSGLNVKEIFIEIGAPSMARVCTYVVERACFPPCHSTRCFRTAATATYTSLAQLVSFRKTCGSAMLTSLPT